MKDTLTFIVKQLVDTPDEVVVEEKEENGVRELTISASKEDIGKVIGKGGKVIRSIRNVMKIVAMKKNEKVYISVNADEQI